MLIVNSAHVAHWVSIRIEGMFPSQGATSIGDIRDGKIVGGVVFDSYTGASIVASIAFDKVGWSRKFIWAIFDYPFNQLGVSKIIAYAHYWNVKSLNLLRKMGFKQEGRIKDVYEDGDMLIMTLTKNDCIWLKRLQHG
jgi:RimJ/RimL family protein N-acetyltransferase